VPLTLVGEDDEEEMAGKNVGYFLVFCDYKSSLYSPNTGKNLRNVVLGT